MELHPGSRSGAALAINQISAVPLQETPMAWTVWAWAIATLGDSRRWKQSLGKVDDQTKALDPIGRLRALFCLLRGACAIADHPEANRIIDVAKPSLKNYKLLRWEFGRVQALLNSQLPPPSKPLINGLKPFEVTALKNRWIFARGITPDPTWND